MNALLALALLAISASVTTSFKLNPKSVSVHMVRNQRTFESKSKLFGEENRKITREGEDQEYFESEFDRTPIKERLPVALGFLAAVSLPFIIGLVYLYSNK